MAGGKLTTYRSTAEEVVDRVVARLPPERERHAPPEAPRPARRWRAWRRPTCPRLGAGPGAGDRGGMARRLGSLAWTAFSLARGPAELAPLVDGVDLSAAEVRAHLRHGAVLHLDDLLLRRVRLAMWEPPAARAVVPALGPLFAEELGWSAPRWEAEEGAVGAALAAWAPEGMV